MSAAPATRNAPEVATKPQRLSILGATGSIGTTAFKLLDKSPAAIRRGLYTLKHTEHMTFEQSMAFTESQIALFALTEDAAEGQAAFREKRKPNWSGR